MGVPLGRLCRWKRRQAGGLTVWEEGFSVDIAVVVHGF
jgi:hypothetical protein